MDTQDVKFPENANTLMYCCDVHFFNIQTLWLFHDLKMKRECQQCLAETIKKKIGITAIPCTEYRFRGTVPHQDLIITVLGLV